MIIIVFQVSLFFTLYNESGINRTMKWMLPTVGGFYEVVYSLLSEYLPRQR